MYIIITMLRNPIHSQTYINRDNTYHNIKSSYKTIISRDEHISQIIIS